ncbi:ribosomal protein S18-alanine N-acetyltransferase [Alkalimonas amylolytica]|uniref:[Ribosomal protein bS18]-alanine N-acetyltransferase n=1 Tax=Alkalimonas amylolytica TaxID=152573 RepID=A0A1H4G4Z4_ALKAM|nr:ribosomal protein S18-alanine N-acetyltransferase [Alkalimonas amylolytica]SEB04120.1 ribosomal-protein-alanine N-acetyltransferase [Alkalimonas amylolytica]
MLTIKPLTAAQLPDILSIEQQAAFAPWSLALFESCLAEDYFNFVLWDKDKLCGYYLAQQVLDEASLFNIVVAPAEQGKGFGRTLLQHMLQQAKQQYCHQVWLEVRASNTAAIALYQSAGFELTGRRKNYYQSSAGADDALVMSLKLSVS